MNPGHGARRAAAPRSLSATLIALRTYETSNAQALVFVGRRKGAFSAEALLKRSRTACKRAGLEPIGLHECRHTYAAFMIAAGVNAKALCSYMGHSSITVTLDRYTHLMPGC